MSETTGVMMIESVVLPMIEEEVATLIFLAKGDSALAITGTKACESPESTVFDVGFRSLMAKSLVGLDGVSVLISDGAKDLAECLAEPEVAGLIVVTSDEAHDIASVASAGQHVAIVRSRGIGAYQIGLWRSSVADAIWTIVDDLRVEVEGAEWSAGVRLHLAGSEPFDFVVGAHQTGRVEDGQPVVRDVESIRKELEEIVLGAGAPDARGLQSSSSSSDDLLHEERSFSPPL
jgi:hypothetical protein